MIFGTIRDTVKQWQLSTKWEIKNQSGNIFAKDDKDKKVLSPEERRINDFKEHIKTDQENQKYARIYSKISSGQDLNPEELNELKRRDPEAYMKYMGDKMEQEAYEKRLRECKTKDEAERLQINKLNGKLTELKSIMNNPNIPKGKKLEEAQRILDNVTKSVKIYNEFIESEEFRELPTEEELLEGERQKIEEQEELLNPEETNELDEEVKTEDGADKVDAEAGNIVGDKIEKENKVGNKVDDENDKSKVTKGKKTKKLVTKDINADVNFRPNRATEVEKAVMKEIFDLQEKHFGIGKKSIKIDMSI
ncbi:MAG: hypothetical protein PHN25_03320 [Tissierellia bacterium]|jgi:hypothetical protein|nr:hypothetical protein [Tissierellia bacterium]NLN80338.1 hypothetical protein [Erysipelotrichia bacterium]